MKSLTVKTIIIFSLSSIALFTHAQVDPALTGAVIAASETEKSVLNDIKSNQSKIAMLQTSIAANMAIVRDYEEKLYSYLSNVSSAVKNAHELKQAATLTGDIVSSISSCANAAARYPEGLLVTALVSKTTTKAAEEMVGIYSYLASLVLNKETLLNSAERNVIMWTVLYKLRLIKSSLFLLQFQIEQYTVAHLPQLLYPTQYYFAVDGKRIADEIIKDFSK